VVDIHAHVQVARKFAVVGRDTQTLRAQSRCEIINDPSTCHNTRRMKAITPSQQLPAYLCTSLSV
jgi:hypothetical protein